MAQQKDLIESVHLQEIAEAMSQIAVNSAQNYNFYRGGDGFISAFTSPDNKHQLAWQSYGYKEDLVFYDFFSMYRRFGMAKSAIELPVTKCWETWPRLVEDKEKHDETEWEKKVSEIFEKKLIWQRFKGGDSRQRVGRFGGLLLIVQDGRTLNQPLNPKGLNPDSLIKIIPLYESQMVVTKYVTDSTSVDFGKPKAYEYIEILPGTNQRTQSRSMIVHASRIFPLAEGSDTDNIYTGVPVLEAAFNDLVTMEKIIGAGGEGFWKNARASFNINYDNNIDISNLTKILGVDSVEEIAPAMGEVVKKYVTGLDENLMTQGADINPMSVALPDPVPHFNVALWSAASSIEIPSTIWIGQQTGRLASDEDQKSWAQANESRRLNFLTPNIREFCDYLMQINLLPSAPSEYFVEWDSLLEPTLKEKLEITKLMSEINKDTLGTGVMAPFSGEQMSQQAGFDFDDGLNLDESDDFTEK